MSDFDPAPRYVPPLPVEEPPVVEADLSPSSTEPPAPEIAAETPVEEVTKEPELRITAEGVVLSKVVVSPEGVILKVED